MDESVFPIPTIHIPTIEIVGCISFVIHLYIPTNKFVDYSSDWMREPALSRTVTG